MKSDVKCDSNDIAGQTVMELNNGGSVCSERETAGAVDYIKKQQDLYTTEPVLIQPVASQVMMYEQLPYGAMPLPPVSGTGVHSVSIPYQPQHF